MRLRKGQRGLSFITIALIFGVFVFFLLTGLKLYPGYYEYFNVRTSLEGLQGDAELTTMDKRAVWRALEKRFDINGVTTVTMDHLLVQVDKKSGRRTIAIKYEYRVPLYGNIDAVLKFEHSILTS